MRWPTLSSDELERNRLRFEERLEREMRREMTAATLLLVTGILFVAACVVEIARCFFGV